MRYRIAEPAHGLPRYTYRRYRESAGNRVRDQLRSRKYAAMERAKLWHRLCDEPLSTSHENHCCRPKPRDRLRRQRRPNLAQERASADWFPF